MVDREVTIDDLKPLNDYRSNHEFWYQVGFVVGDCGWAVLW